MAPRPWILPSLALAALAAIAMYCFVDDDNGHLAECGHDGPPVASALIDAIRAVPEFHDCQRFVIGNAQSLTYDSLFAIYASARLDSLELDLSESLTEPTQVVPLNSGGGGSEVVTPAPGSGGGSGGVVTTQASALSVNHRMVAVALVYAQNSYPALGIGSGINCLYVGRYRPLNASADRWFARMVHVGAVRSEACDPRGVNDSVTSTITPLFLIREVVGDFTASDDYPPVARWDWDGLARQQYVGVKCGTAWCEIGAPGLTRSAPLTVAAGASRPVRRVRSIKGWYDQQYLAKQGPDGKLIPSLILGTIVADPSLGALTKADFNSAPRTVAAVTLEPLGAGDDAALAAYEAKFSFVPNAAGDVYGARPLALKRSFFGLIWRAQIPRSDGSVMDKGIKYRKVGSSFLNDGYEIPAVARWRWLATDEGTWVRCTDGCCEMSDQ